MGDTSLSPTSSCLENQVLSLAKCQVIDVGMGAPPYVGMARVASNCLHHIDLIVSYHARYDAQLPVWGREGDQRRGGVEVVD